VKVNTKSVELAAKYRAKQLAENDHSEKSNSLTHVQILSMQKAASDLSKEQAKRKKDWDEMQECTFKPKVEHTKGKSIKTATLSLEPAEDEKYAGYEAA
jgi:hypothetical protein